MEVVNKRLYWLVRGLRIAQGSRSRRKATLLFVFLLHNGKVEDVIT